jgi:hydroxyacylglutathione hydrolase
MPSNRWWAIVGFWAWYWICFLVLLPLMLLRQIFISAAYFFSTLLTWNKNYSFLNSQLELYFLTSYRSMLASTLFGERFISTRYKNVLIDPGPPFSHASLRQRLISRNEKISGVVLTHMHEEHIGNAYDIAAEFEIPIHGSRITLDSVRKPEELSLARMSLMGQPLVHKEDRGIECGRAINVGGTLLKVIESPGHCEGHLSFYDAENKILFAGDSYLHDEFTSPNKDVNSLDWLRTLDEYLALDVKTLIGSHGVIYTCDERIPETNFVVEKVDPRFLIERKKDFILWAREVVKVGEKNKLPYSVIEASLFPWHKSWTWKNWFNDESFRLFSFGEFSRTHFVRSLSEHPERVPLRFPNCTKLAEYFGLLDLQNMQAMARIHLLAANPRNAYTIVLGIVLSILSIYFSAAGFNLNFENLNPFAFVQTLVDQGKWGTLATSLIPITLIWATLGAAITRQMALDVAGTKNENFWKALEFCFRPALLAPSFLASLCFLIMFSVRPLPLALIIILPIWLFAGFLYSLLCAEKISLNKSLEKIKSVKSKIPLLIKTQLRFLISFGISTSFVYFCCGFFYFVWRFFLKLFSANPWEYPWSILSILIVAYGLGYTTANLKSLQIYLASKVMTENDSR